MPASLPPHSHCVYCDEPIPEGQEFCSDECKNAFMAKRKKTSRRMAIFYIGAAIAFMVIAIMAGI